MHRPRIKQPTGWVACAWALVALCVALVACDGLNSSEKSDKKPDAKTEPSGPTIVSLSPAITQMLIDMGMRDRIVGVSQHDYAGLDLPVCGTYRDPLMARILDLEPAIVLTESGNADGSDVPQRLRSLAEKDAYQLGTIPHSRSIADIERALVDAKVGLGAAVGDPAAADRARRLMLYRLEMVQAVVPDGIQPRVLMLINPMTLGTLGKGVTHDELLKRINAANAAASFGGEYLKLDRAQVVNIARPDVILILEPKGTELTDNDTRLGALRGLQIPALANNRVHVIRHPQAMLPSTSIPEVMVEMACAIYPEQADAIRKVYELADRKFEEAEKKRAGRDGGGS